MVLHMLNTFFINGDIWFPEVVALRLDLTDWIGRIKKVTEGDSTR